MYQLRYSYLKLINIPVGKFPLRKTLHRSCQCLMGKTCLTGSVKGLSDATVAPLHSETHYFQWLVLLHRGLSLCWAKHKHSPACHSASSWAHRVQRSTYLNFDLCMRWQIAVWSVETRHLARHRRQNAWTPNTVCLTSLSFITQLWRAWQGICIMETDLNWSWHVRCVICKQHFMCPPSIMLQTYEVS